MWGRGELKSPRKKLGEKKMGFDLIGKKSFDKPEIGGKAKAVL